MRPSVITLVLLTVVLCLDAAGQLSEPQVASTLGQGPPPGDICMEDVRVSPVWVETSHPYYDPTLVELGAESPSLCFSHVFGEADADFVSLHFSGIDIADSDYMEIVYADEVSEVLERALL